LFYQASYSKLSQSTKLLNGYFLVDDYKQLFAVMQSHQDLHQQELRDVMMETFLMGMDAQVYV